MTQQITTGVKALVEAANKMVDEISIEEAKKLYNNENYVFIDVREADERRKLGLIPYAFTCPRGMLEFLIDPALPSHNKVFAQDKTYVFYCAKGLRSLFAAHQAALMGLAPVKNLAGGFSEWLNAKGEVAAEPTQS